jgi:hypothetical protein
VLSYPCCSELFNHRARRGGPPRSFPGAENQELASILLCPYIYILGSHTDTLYIGVTSNQYLRVMQHKEGTCFRASVVEKLRTAWVR